MNDFPKIQWHISGSLPSIEIWVIIKIRCYKNLDFLQDGDEVEFDNASKVINNATTVFFNKDSALYNDPTLCMRGNY
jgi:hypothetical protein